MEVLMKRLTDLTKDLSDKGLEPIKDFKTSTYEGLTILTLHLPTTGNMRLLILD